MNALSEWTHLYGGDLICEIKRYKLLNTTQINSKSQLYCTGNYIQCNMGKNLKKNMYIILLDTWNQHNIVNQLYLNEKTK